MCTVTPHLACRHLKCAGRQPPRTALAAGRRAGTGGGVGGGQGAGPRGVHQNHGGRLQRLFRALGRHGGAARQEQGAHRNRRALAAASSSATSQIQLRDEDELARANETEGEDMGALLLGLLGCDLPPKGPRARSPALLTPPASLLGLLGASPTTSQTPQRPAWRTSACSLPCAPARPPR